MDLVCIVKGREGKWKIIDTDHSQEPIEFTMVSLEKTSGTKGTIKQLEAVKPHHIEEVVSYHPYKKTEIEKKIDEMAAEFTGEEFEEPLEEDEDDAAEELDLGEELGLSKDTEF